MAMLAIAALLFFPALAHGSILGQAVKGEAGPLGISLVVGSFLFGVGMQLGGGCAIRDALHGRRRQHPGCW